jgi:integrase
MKTQHIHFNQKTIDSLPLPTKEEKSKIYYDKGCDCGLTLIVTYGGSKTYYFYKKYQGKPIRIKIAKANEMRLANARMEADRLNRMAAEGQNPKNNRLEILHNISFGDFYSQHYKPKHMEPFKKAGSIRNDEANYRLYLQPAFANRKMLSITKDELSQFILDLMKNKGKYTANRVFSLVRHMYHKAKEWGFISNTPDLPTDGIKTFPEKSRDRFMSGEEIRRFFTALYENPNETFKQYIMLSLFLGQRRNNILALKWSDVDFNSKSVYFADTKNGEALTVPLTEQAYKLLRYIQKNAAKNDIYVFPSKTSASGHYEEPKTAWKSLLKKANIENLRLHDLRRTMGSYQAIAGASLQVIGKSLGHKSASATQIYARLTIDPIRDSMQRATDTMMGFVEKQTL